jgi:hypothetical protein
VSSRVTASFVSCLALVAMACRQPMRDAACVPERGVELWVERRFPPTVEVADTAFASLSIAIARDSTARLPEGSVISVVIAGPSGAPLPDTVRVLSAELPPGGSLWRGDQLRPGQYTAQLTTTGYAAGPRTFSLAGGERVEVEARLHQSSSCEAGSAQHR